MAEHSAIGWTDSTWITMYGCSKVSAGCGECYIPHTPPFRKAGLRFERGRIPLIFHEHRLEDPLRWRKPRRIFVNSLSDTFHEDVPVDWIARMWAVMNAARRHTFQVLTKRPERMRDVLGSPEFWDRVDHWSSVMWNGESRIVGEPLPNVWLATTIENRSFVWRADVLREIPAAARFISAEPLLGPLVAQHHLAVPPIDDEGDGDPEDWEVVPFWSDQGQPGGPTELDLTGIDQVIIGGESGQHFGRKQYRFLVDRDRQPIPHKLEWVRDLRDRCVAEGVAFNFKQWGGLTTNWAGRELDGRTWDEFPRVTEVARA